MRALALCLLLSGCSFYDVRHAPASCMFGGSTPETDLVCAEKNFGNSLFAINAHARELGGDCKAHVRAVARMRPDALGVYTTVRGIGHVSALVDGYVLDNGALGIPGDVMALDEFRKWYGPEFEIGPPT